MTTYHLVDQLRSYCANCTRCPCNTDSHAVTGIDVAATSAYGNFFCEIGCRCRHCGTRQPRAKSVLVMFQSRSRMAMYSLDPASKQQEEAQPRQHQIEPGAGIRIEIPPGCSQNLYEHKNKHYYIGRSGTPTYLFCYTARLNTSIVYWVIGYIVLKRKFLEQRTCVLDL